MARAASVDPTMSLQVPAPSAESVEQLLLNAWQRNRDHSPPPPEEWAQIAVSVASFFSATGGAEDTVAWCLGHKSWKDLTLATEARGDPVAGRDIFRRISVLQAPAIQQLRATTLYRKPTTRQQHLCVAAPGPMRAIGHKCAGSGCPFFGLPERACVAFVATGRCITGPGCKGLHIAKLCAVDVLCPPDMPHPSGVKEALFQRLLSWHNNALAREAATAAAEDAVAEKAVTALAANTSTFRVERLAQMAATRKRQRTN